MQAARPSGLPPTERPTAPLRVLTVARWYPSHDSPGRGSFVADLVRATAGAGVESRVVSFDRVLVRGPVEERDAVLLAARAAYEPVATPDALFVTPISRGAPGVPVARIPLVRRPGSDDPSALVEDHLAALQPFVERLVRQWRPNVIHAHTGLPDGIVAAAVGRRLGIPVIVTEHMSTIETVLAEPAALERYRDLLEPSVQLLAVSPSLSSRVAALLGVPADRIGVLPNPVPDAAFPAADPAGRDPNELLWVGSLGEHKGIEVLLRAFAMLHARRPGVHLRLVGKERTNGQLERWEGLATTLGVRPAVSFDGWLARDQVALAMAGAGAFVHPSPSETFGVAAAEAILTGLPVAARPSGGVPWIIELSGGFGRVADGDDPDGFARSIEAVLDGPFAVDPPTARWRLVDEIGEHAVGREALELYRGAAGGAAPKVDSGESAPRSAMPRVLVATGRSQALGLVAALPAELQRRLTLVVPPPTAGAADDPRPGAGPASLFVEMTPVPPRVPRSGGGNPLARLRRAVQGPAPNADQRLGSAILAAARTASTGRGPAEIVAIDAPAAALVGRLDARQVTLAPGALRWLADRWDAEGPDVVRPA